MRRSIRNPIVGARFKGLRISSESRPSGLVATIPPGPPTTSCRLDRGARSGSRCSFLRAARPWAAHRVGRGRTGGTKLRGTAHGASQCSSADPPTSMVGRLHPEHIDPDPHASSSLGLTGSKRWPVAVRAFRPRNWIDLSLVIVSVASVDPVQEIRELGRDPAKPHSGTVTFMDGTTTLGTGKLTAGMATAERRAQALRMMRSMDVAMCPPSSNLMCCLLASP